MQHDYFSSFNRSDHCFLASSLPLPSSLLKLPNDGSARGIVRTLLQFDNIRAFFFRALSLTEALVLLLNKPFECLVRWAQDACGHGVEDCCGSLPIVNALLHPLIVFVLS